MAKDHEERQRSTTQHVLILAVRDFLAKRQHPRDPSSIQCYAQDPVYTTADRQVLEDEGITVLDYPRGFLEIDEGKTVVLSHAPNVPARQIAAGIARPAMVIWDKVQYRSIPLDAAESPGEIHNGVWYISLLYGSRAKWV